MAERNRCYTYFRITGCFDPDVVTGILGLVPDHKWSIGDRRKNGTVYDFASWDFGKCDQYDVVTSNQMMQTIKPLVEKVEQLKQIKAKYDVWFTLEIVPSIYAGGTNPCLAPSKEVIRFCYETDTDMDIDLYLFDSTD